MVKALQSKDVLQLKLPASTTQAKYGLSGPPASPPVQKRWIVRRRIKRILIVFQEYNPIVNPDLKRKIDQYVAGSYRAEHKR